MLLNLSNHPSSAWSDMQMQNALHTYGSVEDLPFPHVDPDFDEDELEHLVLDYLGLVLSRKPKAVHLMGELNFCVSLVGKLHKEGIPCVASTTHRTTEDLSDGTKVSKFEFVRFRQYRP